MLVLRGIISRHKSLNKDMFLFIIMYDTIIVGAGPAGLSAAIYAARFKLKTLVVSKDIGGTAWDAHNVENYPGFKHTTGMELTNLMKEQAVALGAEIIEIPITSIEKKENFVLTAPEGEVYESKSVILATGTRPTKLNVPGEDVFLGKGVSYCATCDAAFYKNRIVAVFGSSNSAVDSALLLCEYADKVYFICSKDKLRADALLAEKIMKNSKVEFIYKANVAELKGTKFLESIKLSNGSELGVDGLFVEVGGAPSSDIAKQLGAKIDGEGYIMVDSAQKTSVEGVFAAGDITTGSNKLRQIITAAAEGAVAAKSAYAFVRK